MEKTENWENHFFFLRVDHSEAGACTVAVVAKWQ